MIKAGHVIAALSVAAALAGCSADLPFDDPVAEYVQRIPTITPTAGNAQAANAAIQTIDPWPRYAFNTRIPGNGERMVHAIKCYEQAAPTTVTSSQTAQIGGVTIGSAGSSTSSDCGQGK